MKYFIWVQITSLCKLLENKLSREFQLKKVDGLLPKNESAYNSQVC